MKIYLASGYSVMNKPGLEKELASKFKNWRRLISFYDQKRMPIGDRNNIYRPMLVKAESMKNSKVYIKQLKALIKKHRRIKNAL